MTLPGSAQPVGRRILVNTFALISSSMWRIAISFALQLLIARSLGVEALGQYTVALAYLNVCQVISELGLPSLLIRDLAYRPTQRRGWFRIALPVQVAAAFVAWLGLFVITWMLPFTPTTQIALRLVGASLPLYAITSSCLTQFQAGERMEYVMGLEVLINFLILAVSIAVLIMGGGVLRLIAVLVVTQSVSALLAGLLLVHSRLLSGTQTAVHTTPQDLWRSVAPFYALSLADVFQQRIDILLLSAVGGDVVTGIYSAAYNVVRVLVKLVQSYWKATYPTFSRLHHDSVQQYRRLCSLSLRYGLMLLLPCASLGTATASGLLSLTYSDAYVMAAPVFRTLIWSAPLLLVETFAVTLLLVEHRARQSLLIMGIHLATVMLLLPPMTDTWGVQGAAWSIVMAGILGMACSVLLLIGMGVAIELSKSVILLVGAILAGVFAAWLPFAWPLQLMAGGVGYLLYVWATGALSRYDLDIFRTALRATK